MKVEVCHADAERATRVEVELEVGATLADALRASGLVERLALDVATLTYGIFGRRAPLDAVLDDGDRVELHRPLIVEPKEARRRRVAIQKARQGHG